MKKIIFIVGLMLSAAVALTQSVNKAVPPRPEPFKLANDFTKTLTGDQLQALDDKLQAFDKKTSTQIAVVIVPDLKGYEISEYALAVLRNWGVGQKDKNNGVILLIAKDERKVRIETGYGSEGALPDATCRHIIDEDIVPMFKQKDFYGGINAGTDKIIKALQGEYTAPEGYGETKISGKKIILLIILVIILLAFFSSGNGGGSFMSRRGYRGWSGGTIFWPSGGWGGGGSGGGGGWSGGFGGGSGGGGGASGSW